MYPQSFVRSFILLVILFVNSSSASCWSFDTNYALCSLNDTNISVISDVIPGAALSNEYHGKVINAILRNSCQQQHFYHQQTTNLSMTYRTPTTFQRYFYGFIAVLIVSSLSLVGLLVVPILYKMSFTYVLDLFTAIATGTLVGDTMFHLIPFILGLHDHSFHEHDDPNHMSSSTLTYQWKILFAVSMLYIFYLLEVFLHWFAHYRHDHRSRQPHVHDQRKRNQELYTSINMDIDLEHSHLYHNYTHHNFHQHLNSPSIYSNAKSFFHPTSPPCTPCTCVDRHDITENQFFPANLRENILSDQNEHISLTAKHYIHQFSEDEDHLHPVVQELKTVKSTGWMVLFGDGVHNFADGLAIAAAFSQDLVLGVTTTFAIACHELPHELGDYTVLLQSGFSHSRALLWNFLSAASAIIGFFIGSILLDNEHVRQWIFAATTGMFLYIALVDLLPTLLAHEEIEFKRFLVVNIGLLFGITTMFLLALFESKIITLSIR